MENEDKKLGDTGSTNFFEGNYKLEMYPSESVLLNYSLDSFNPKDTTVSIESSNEAIVKVDKTGVVTAQAEGFASVTVKVLLDDESTYYSETVNVEVKDPYITTGASLTHYYGNGGLVDIPADLSVLRTRAFQKRRSPPHETGDRFQKERPQTGCAAFRWRASCRW